MRFLLACASKDLRRRLHDPLSLLLWTGLPLVIALLMMLAFGRGGRPPEAQLLVADEDESLVSTLLIGAFEQEPLADMVNIERVDQTEGLERMERGKASALLVIPAGFGAAALRQLPARLLLIQNPSQQILPQIVEEALRTLLEAAFYLQRLLRQPLDAVIGGPGPGATTFSDSAVAAVSVTVNDLIERVQPYLFPPAIELEVVDLGPDAGPRPSIGELFVPGMLVLSLLFIAQALSEDIWKERARGTLRRVLVSPQRVALFLGGKLLAGGAVFAAVGIVGLAAAALLVGQSFGNLPVALFWLTAAGVVLLSVIQLIQLYAGSERGGNLLTFLLIFPLAIVGGSFFPFEIMPPWLAAIGRRTPNGWILTQLSGILRGEARLESMAPALAVLLLLGAAGFALSARRLAGGFSRG
jgi:ABC-type Na+ efflux pump permease subunit